MTLEDLAERVGVTKMTVSRALNSPELVSVDTLQRVREAVRQTGYTPDLIAGSLASTRSRLVVALIPAMAGSVFQETVEVLTTELAAAGYQLLIGQSGYDESREDVLLDAVIGRRPAGIVLTGVAHSESARLKLRASGIPVVETWDLTTDPIDMLVGFSHEKVGRAAAEFLRERGATRPAVLTPSDRRAHARTEAFLKAWRNADSIPVVTLQSPAHLGDGRRALASLLDGHAVPDAVFCGADTIALGVLMEAHARKIDVPRQLRVIGYGDLNFARETTPALSTVRVDGTKIGSLAAAMLMDRIEKRGSLERTVDVGFSIVERESA
ncbi:LacI family DNA-binding transcriptional regulator [Paraburkholderia sp.]|uniref:LacI family DNA-binding transcriptional regulator n=1 Tax=Paraburkholderia sp. TaxID=1926495 RepID=UPI003D6F0AC2